MSIENSFESNGLKLFTREWLVDNPKKLVVIAHGLGEHSGRYEHVANALNESGYSVFALDHQGHGQSEGQRGHVNSFTDYHQDLHAFIQQVQAKHPGLEVHLLGHSMGALIATGYAMRYTDIASVILTAPPYGVPGKAANIQLKIGAFIGRFLPTTGLSNQIDPHEVCKNKEVVQKYIDDEWVHDQISLGWGTAFVNEQKFVLENISKLVVPYFLILAKEDKLTDCQVAENLFPTVGSEHKKLVVYPESYHEILNEVEEGANAVNLIITWLDQRKIGQTDFAINTPHIPENYSLEEGLALLQSVSDEVDVENENDEIFHKVQTDNYQFGLYESEGTISAVWYDDPLGRETQDGINQKVTAYLARYGEIDDWREGVNNGWIQFFHNDKRNIVMAYGIHMDVIRFNFLKTDIYA